MAENQSTQETSSAPALVGADAIAKLLGVGHSTVRKMAEAKTIPSVRVGGSLLRFSAAEVLEAVRRNNRIPAIGERGHVAAPVRIRTSAGDDEANPRTAALVRTLASFANTLDSETALAEQYSTTAILQRAEELGEGAVIAAGTASPQRAVGKLLSGLRGRLFKDSKGRSFEVLRETTRGNTLYFIRF